MTPRNFFSLCSLAGLIWAQGIQSRVDAGASSETIQLNGKAEYAVAAGGSKFLALKLEKQATCSLLKIADSQIHREFELQSADAIIAANNWHLFAFDESTLSIKKWDLFSGELVAAVPLPVSEISAVACGAFSSEQLLVVHKKDSSRKLTVLDAANLSIRELEPADQSHSNKRFESTPGSIHASADGTAFASAGPHERSNSLQSLTLLGNRYRIQSDSVSPVYARFDFSGRHIFTAPNIFSPSLAPLSSRRDYQAIRDWIPAVDSDWSVRFELDGTAAMIAPDSSIETCSIAGFPIQDSRTKGYFDREGGRSYFYFSAGKIVKLSNTNPSLAIYSFDSRRELQRSGNPFLAILTSPDPVARAGEEYRCQLDFLSSTGTADISLLSAPEGMHLDAEATELKWRVPSNAETSEQAVQIQFSNTDRQIGFLKFVLRIQGVPDGIQLVETSEIKRSNGIGSIPEKGIDVPLPAEGSRATLAGSGRFLAVFMASLSKIAIFDMQDLRIARLVPVPKSQDVEIAATSSTLYALLPRTSRIITYDLFTGEQLGQADISLAEGNLSDIAAGPYGNGPIAVSYADPNGMRRQWIKLLTPSSLKAILPPFEGGQMVMASGDGRVFWSRNQNYQFVHDVSALRLQERIQRPRLDGALWAIPNFNGSVFYSDTGRRTAAQLFQPPQRIAQPRMLHYPASHGNLYLRSAAYSRGGSRPTALFVHSQGDDQLVESYTNLPEFFTETYRHAPFVHDWQRVYLIPEYGVLALVPVSSDRIHLRPFAPISRLENSGLSYLLVDSLPPPAAMQGQEFKYRPKIVSRAGGVKIFLESGPKGMQLNDGADAELSWTPPIGMSEATVRVALRITDASQRSIRHVFDLRIDPEVSQVTEVPEVLAASAISHSQADDRSLVDAAKSNSITSDTLTASTSPAPVYREWTDTSGKLKTRAAFIELINRTKVRLLREDTQQIVVVELSRLSPNDIEYATQKGLEATGGKDD